MNTYLTTKDEKSCCGCLSCVYSCPTGAISVENRFDAFAFPTVDAAKCVGCDKCRKACPNDCAEAVISPIRRTFALKHKSDETRKRSSSGGAFTAISDCLMEDGYKVYGAVFDGTYRHVMHVGSASKDDRDRMRISKYVESSLKGIYPAVRSELDAGQRVFFTGTPCQVAGLKAFLSKEYDSLFTMDFVCHGVFSPKLMSDYIELLSNGSKIAYFAFRDKTNSTWEASEKPTIQCEDTSNLRYLPYCYRLISRSFGHRPSCSACKYAQSSRPSDITVGDLWSAGWLCPELKDDLGVSFLSVNTDKGQALLDRLKESCTLRELDKEKAVSSAEHLNRPSRPSYINDMFWKYYKRHSPRKTIELYGGDSLKSKLMRKPFEYINAKRK